MNPLYLQEAYFQVYENQQLSEEVKIATEYFYNQGLNEEGIEILIDKVGIDEFVDWIYDISESYELNEARRSGRIEPVTKSGKDVGQLKGGAKSAAISRLRKEKQKRRESEESASASKPSGLKAALRSQAEKSAKTQQKPTPKTQKSGETKGGIGRAIGGALNWAKKKAETDIKHTRQGLETLGQTWKKSSDTKAAQRVRIGMKKGSRAIEKHGHAVGSAAGRAAGTVARKLMKDDFELWVDDLIQEGYDLSEYTWDEMYEIYESQTDSYDLVLDYLVNEGFADNEESANVIMVNMSEEWRDEILEKFVSPYKGRVSYNNPQGLSPAMKAGHKSDELQRSEPGSERQKKQTRRSQQLDRMFQAARRA